jgi:hypothetical protein
LVMLILPAFLETSILNDEGVPGLVEGGSGGAPPIP